MYELYTLYCGTKMWKHDAKNVDKQKVLGCKSVFTASIDVLRDQPIKLILEVSTSEFLEKDLFLSKSFNCLSAGPQLPVKSSTYVNFGPKLEFLVEKWVFWCTIQGPQ